MRREKQKQKHEAYGRPGTSRHELQEEKGHARLSKEPGSSIGWLLTDFDPKKVL